MSTLDHEKINIPCPGCHKPVSTTVNTLYSSRHVKCMSCGSEVEITSSGATGIRSAIQNVEKAQKKVEDAEKGVQLAAKEFKESISEAVTKATLHVKKK